MKSVFTFIILLFCTTLFCQFLTNSGDIKSTNTEHCKQINRDGNDFIQYNSLQLQGNGFYKTARNLITVESTCGNTAPFLRLFSLDGQQVFLKKYIQVINLQSNLNGEFIYFLSEGKWIILNTLTFEETIVNSSYPIAVDDKGKPAYFEEVTNNLHFKNETYKSNKQVYIFQREQFSIINANGTLQNMQNQSGTFFKAKIIDGNVFWVEKNKKADMFDFQLFTKQDAQIDLLETQHFPYKDLRKTVNTSQNLRMTNEAIYSPLYPDSTNYPFRIGNSYAEHQDYNGSPYLHPGVDLLGDIGQPVYACKDGIVKSVITTSASLHWRIAISNSGTDEEEVGYLYAHLVESTIPYTVGDSIFEGDYLGDLVEWPTSNFHHLHFARIKHSGITWDGTWNTVDNVLEDIINYSDSTAPIFETLYNNNTMAFESATQNNLILEPDSLYGAVNIICHAHDLSNDNWRIDVGKLSYALYADTNDAPIFTQHSFNYDFTLDLYGDNIGTGEILNTIYNTDGDWETLGNYNTREFYQIVSRSNGDDTLDFTDFVSSFDTELFPDGNYTFRIYAEDAKGNESHTDLAVQFKNYVPPILSVNSFNNTTIQINPNPSNGNFTISNAENVDAYEVYTTEGKLLSYFKFEAIGNTFNLNQLEEGVYHLKIYFKGNKTETVKNIVIAK